MISMKALLWATAAGTLLQLAMVVAGHEIEAVKSAFLWGGLLFSAVAGGMYVKIGGGTLPRDLVAGLIAGGGCAFAGILVSYLLGDVPAGVLLLGTVSSAVTGLIAAVLRREFR